MARLFFLVLWRVFFSWIELVNERRINLSVIALRNSWMVNPTKNGAASSIHFALQVKNAPVAKEVHKAPPKCALAYVIHFIHFIPFKREALIEHPNFLRN